LAQYFKNGLLKYCYGTHHNTRILLKNNDKLDNVTQSDLEADIMFEEATGAQLR